MIHTILLRGSSMMQGENLTRMKTHIAKATLLWGSPVRKNVSLEGFYSHFQER